MEYMETATVLLARYEDVFNTAPLRSAVMTPVLKLNIQTEVVPYKSLGDILDFLLAAAEGELPEWMSEISVKNTFPGTSYCIPHSQLLQEPRTTLHRSSVPKTMVCHDYKGGYLADRLVSANCNGRSDVSSFTQWHLIDTFVYFSHHLVTVPPPCWITVAHAHGVAILGTLITEGKEGKALWDKVLATELRWKFFAEALALIADIHQFDGYLVNVENLLDRNQVPIMVKFLKYLRNKLPEGSQVIWYDSVTKEGKLEWQNALNSLNQVFFDACDGIYLNYGYQNWQLEKSSLLAGSRKHDVFVGVDIFGRGCPGSGFCASDAVAMAREHDLSVAIFAPGWTREVAPGDPIKNETIFWTSLSKYLYVHGTRSVMHKISLGCGEITKESNFNQFLDMPSDLCLWAGRTKRVVLPLMLPSTHPEKERKVLLDMQEAVVTFHKQEVEEFYCRLPKALLRQDAAAPDQSTCNGLTIDTTHQNDAVTIPLLLLENGLSDGVSVSMKYHITAANGASVIYIVVEDEKYRKRRFSKPILETPSLNCATMEFRIHPFMETNVRVLEVGVLVYPSIVLYIDDVTVDSSLPPPQRGLRKRARDSDAAGQ